MKIKWVTHIVMKALLMVFVGKWPGNTTNHHIKQLSQGSGNMVNDSANSVFTEPLIITYRVHEASYGKGRCRLSAGQSVHDSYGS